tara:strand:- start:1173 stop:1319 length:147 start_codon:yes stop_codon:yes gene_type:complete
VILQSYKPKETSNSKPEATSENKLVYSKPCGKQIPDDSKFCRYCWDKQ